MAEAASRYALKIAQELFPYWAKKGAGSRLAGLPGAEAEGQSCPDLALATGAGRMVSLIPSLIHVVYLGSIAVYCRALSRVYGPAWSVLDGHP